MPAPDPKNIIKKIRQSGIMAVFYHEDPEICKEILKACCEGGIRVFEFTNRGARAQESYLMLKNFVQRDLPETYVGFGDVKDIQTAEIFINLNADFIMSPIMDPEIGQICRDHKVLWIPGCSTPTEIAAAEKNGATLLQLFPGEVISASFVKAMKPLFPSIQFIPSGDIEPAASAIIPWLESGVTAIGMGRKMITNEMIASGDYASLKEHIKKMLKTIRQWRKQSIV